MEGKKYIVQSMGMISTKYGGLEEFLVLLGQKLKKENIGLILIYNSLPWSKKFLGDFEKTGGFIFVSDAMKPFRFFKDVRKIFLKFNPIIIHAHFQFHYPVFISKIFFQKKVFVTLHGMVFNKAFNVAKSRKELKKSTIISRKFVNLLADKVFTVSEAIKNQYVNLFPQIRSKICTHYIGTKISENYTRPQNIETLFPAGKILIGNIGFNAAIKGFDVLINSLAIIKNELNCTSFHLIQIGIDINDSKNKNLLSLVEEKGLTDYVTWIGIQDNVKEILPELDVYCQPSRSEGISLSIMEACYAGLPIVASNVGGIPELVKDAENGFLVEPENSSQLANKLHHLIQKKELRLVMGKNSKEHIIKNFSLEIQTTSLVELYLKEIKKNNKV